MKKHRTGYAAWLLLTLCLYFFENNTGTRAVLLCSLLVPMIPLLRSAFFTADEPEEKTSPEPPSQKTFFSRESEDPGDIRAYLPGDPVKRIHWKLSAKKDDLLVRETAAEPEEAEEETGKDSGADNSKMKSGKTAAMISAAGILLCLILLLAIPEARLGAQALCNRLFAASEAVNTYIYRRFPVPDEQNILPAAFLLAAALVLLSALAVSVRSRLAVFGIAAAYMVFLAYFGLALPAWIHIPLCGLAALRMMKRPYDRKTRKIFCGFVLAVSILTALVLPGTNAATETVSEKVRDSLNDALQKITGTIPEAPEGETETRRIHPRSMENGNREAETEKEFQLVTVEEEPVSMPHWVNWVRMILMLAAAVALIVVPFIPFWWLNARRKKAHEIRKSFSAGTPGEAVQIVFRRVIAWLEASGYGSGNLLYRNWTDRLPDSLPEGYTERFARCAADFEEAAYSGHEIPEEKRRDALALLAETEAALWKDAGLKQRFYLKYWMCLRE